MPSRRIVASALLAGLLACGGSATDVVPDEGESTELPDLNAQLTGTFTGSFRSEIVRSEDDVSAIEGVMTLELAESDDGSFAGVFVLEGILSEDQLRLRIVGHGPVAGFVSAGQSAALSFTVTPAGCPTHTVAFSGELDRRVGQLQIEGPIHILDQFCTIVWTFPTLMWLGPVT